MVRGHRRTRHQTRSMSGVIRTTPGHRLRTATIPYLVSEQETTGIRGRVGSMAKAQHAPRYRHLPAMLRRMREAAGLTQRQLAARLRTTHVFVHKSEIGERRVDVAEF